MRKKITGVFLGQEYSNKSTYLKNPCKTFKAPRRLEEFEREIREIQSTGQMKKKNKSMAWQFISKAGKSTFKYLLIS